MTLPATASLVADLVDVPAGRFVMGSTPDEIERCVAYWGTRLVEDRFDEELFRQWISKEAPAHPVELPAYRIGRFPVTNAQYAAFVAATGAPRTASLDEEASPDHPVWGLTVDAAAAFLEWVTAETGLAVRLPTEAEWERAARGPGRPEYPFGDEFDPRRCNTNEAGLGGTSPVDRYRDHASGFGVCDLAGNVEELTADRYRPYPGGVFVDDDLSRALGPDYPVIRGGSFARGGDLARCARRHGPYPAAPYRYIGFRIAAGPTTTTG